MSSDYVLVEPIANGPQDVTTDSHDDPIAVTTSVIEGPFPTYEKAEERRIEQYGELSVVSIPSQDE